MNVYLISDTHFNHDKIATYCDRPSDFTERIIRNWQNIVKPSDTVIHLGDVMIGNRTRGVEQVRSLPGRKILIRGNHDRQSSCGWWMEHGFDFVCDGMKFRNCWLTHEPSPLLTEGCELNLHGHLHNIWHGFQPEGRITPQRLHHDHQRLFAIEYTNYMPIEFDKFVMQPDKWQARGPKKL